MFDVATFVVSAVVGSIGGCAGALLTHRWLSRAPKAPILMCSCKHGFGIHKDGGPCQAQVERTSYGPGGTRLGNEWVPCGCQVYDGPEPLPRTWTGSGLYP
jgi:hypothetical protein